MMRCPGGFATGVQAESSQRQYREHAGMSLIGAPALCEGSRALRIPSPEPTESCIPDRHGVQSPSVSPLPACSSPVFRSKHRLLLHLFPSLTTSLSASCALGPLRWSFPLPLRIRVLSLVALCLPPEALSAGWVLPQHGVPPPTRLALPEAEGQRRSQGSTLLH